MGWVGKATQNVLYSHDMSHPIPIPSLFKFFGTPYTEQEAPHLARAKKHTFTWKFILKLGQQSYLECPLLTRYVSSNSVSIIFKVFWDALYIAGSPPPSLGKKTNLHIEIHTEIGSAKLFRMSSTHTICLVQFRFHHFLSFSGRPIHSREPPT